MNKHENFREWLSDNKLILEDLAGVVGVKQQAVSYYLSKNKFFPSEWIYKWSDTYGLTAWEMEQIFLFNPNKLKWVMA